VAQNIFANARVALNGADTSFPTTPELQHLLESRQPVRQPRRQPQYFLCGWRLASGYDANSTQHGSAVSKAATHVFVRPNPCESNRANITVFDCAHSFVRSSRRLPRLVSVLHLAISAIVIRSALSRNAPNALFRMKAKKSKPRKRQQQNGSLADVNDALAAVSDEQWRQLARLAESLLKDLKNEPRLASYLAGARGEELVNTAVAAVQLGAQSPGKGRTANGQHLADNGSFLEHLKQIIRSIANNFRRHQAGQFPHQPIDDKAVDGVAYEPADPFNLQRDIDLKDLIDVLLTRVFQELQGKPKQLSVLQEWAQSNGHDAMLPAV